MSLSLSVSVSEYLRHSSLASHSSLRVSFIMPFQLSPVEGSLQGSSGAGGDGGGGDDCE